MADGRRFGEIWYAGANFDPGDEDVSKFRYSQIQDGGHTPY